MNKVLLIGRLTKDPELKFSTSGTSVAHFTLAVDRNYVGQSGQREADFINCVCFKKAAENVANNLSKGRLVAVAGSIQTSKYQAQDGSNRYKTEVVVSEVKFLDYAKSQGSTGNEGSSYSGQETGGFTEIDDSDDIPF